MLITKKAHKDLLDTLRFADKKILALNAQLNRAERYMSSLNDQLDKRDGEIKRLSDELINAKYDMANVMVENMRLRAKLNMQEDGV